MAQAAVVGTLTEKFTSMLVEKIFNEVSLVTAFGEDFQFLCEELTNMKELLRNAVPLLDARDEMVSSSISNWLNKVEEFLTDADYIVEECALVTNCQFRNPIFRYRMGRKINGLKDRISDIKRSSKHFKYFESVLALNDRFQASEKLEDKETSSLVLTEQDPVGMEEDIKKITDFILQEEGRQRIAIFGMGGSGKTLLLHHAFNNKRVLEAGFTYRVWLPISQKFGYHALLIEICRQIKPSILKSGDLNDHGLKESITTLLKGKRCLFAMDDVWDKISFEKIGLEFQGQKIKVVITTRNKDLAEKYGEVHKVGFLSPENSWTLFCNHAFPIEHKPPEEHIEVAQKIAERCGGLPLALKTVGRYMAVRSIDEWKSTLEHLQADAMSDIMKCLKLSYQDLPFHLKPCFVYMCAFPKNTEIEAEYLVYAWISEGFVSSREDDYNVGFSYVNQLINRCLIEGSEFSSNGRVKLCKIHDLLHDLAGSVKQPRWLLKPGGELDKLPDECYLARTPLNNISKLSLIKNNIPKMKKAIQSPRLITLFLSDNRNLTSISPKFFNNLGYLKVLDLSRTCIKSVPWSIGRLNHLKLLNLSSTKIGKLPESLSNLRSLIFLDVSNCSNLTGLHQGIGNHKVLRHLNVDYTELKWLPVGISKLVSLETLKGVKFNSENATNANALQLRDLKGLTRLTQLSMTIDANPPYGIFVDMKNMRTLSCHNNSLEINLIQLPEDMDAMKRLEIVRLNKCDVPKWMFRLPSLMELEFRGPRDTCGNDYEGLENIPNLRKLLLCFFTSFPKKFGQENAFPKLEELFLEFSDFHSFPLLENNAMPKLKKLRLRNCTYQRDGHYWQILKNRKVLVTSLSGESKNEKEIPIDFDSNEDANDEVGSLSAHGRETKNEKDGEGPNEEVRSLSGHERETKNEKDGEGPNEEVRSLSGHERETKNEKDGEVPNEEVTNLSGDERERKNEKDAEVPNEEVRSLSGHETEHVDYEVRISE